MALFIVLLLLLLPSFGKIRGPYDMEINELVIRDIMLPVVKDRRHAKLYPNIKHPQAVRYA
ncbi:hypothetical protein [Sphingobacterium athyrii]|uniref:hypothetical protein n=1 Tax=Sphingobacterium athyrii TaxID=2152717 RepID=UPI0028A60B87|nr:hypothetical protein [Sphingobacterium athyrii]